MGIAKITSGKNVSSLFQFPCCALFLAGKLHFLMIGLHFNLNGKKEVRIWNGVLNN